MPNKDRPLQGSLVLMAFERCSQTELKLNNSAEICDNGRYKTSYCSGSLEF